jgi:hypothetical protein
MVNGSRNGIRLICLFQGRASKRKGDNMLIVHTSLDQLLSLLGNAVVFLVILAVVIFLVL